MSDKPEERLEPQDVALRKAYETLSEFFPQFVVIVSEPSDTGRPEQDEATSVTIRHYGGFPAALGLMSIGRDILMYNGRINGDKGYDDYGTS